jgi:hypothetical protein
MWAIEDEVLLFRDDHLAQKLAKSIHSPAVLTGQDDGSAWAVRGVSAESLEYLQSLHAIRTIPWTTIRDPGLLAQIKKVQAVTS